MSTRWTLLIRNALVFDGTGAPPRHEDIAIANGRIAARGAALDPARATPAERLSDGRDFVPTNKWILLGHHFAAIAGPGPLVGPTLAAQFLEQDLIDELWLIVHPVVLGTGTPFFPSLPEPRRLELIESRTFTSGAVALGYRVVHT